MHMKRSQGRRCLDLGADIWMKTMCLAAVCSTQMLAMPLLAVVKEVQVVLNNQHSADLDFR